MKECHDSDTIRLVMVGSKPFAQTFWENIDHGYLHAPSQFLTAADIPVRQWCDLSVANRARIVSAK